MNFSPITDSLLVGTTPGRDDFDLLREMGVGLVINMRFLRGTRPPEGDPAIRYLWLRTFDNPLLPIPLRSLISGVHSALEVMTTGGKVYTHCAAGRHRSVAMAAAILIAQGLGPDGAMQLIKERRAVADPEIYYIRRRIMLFAQQWPLLNFVTATP